MNSCTTAAPMKFMEFNAMLKHFKASTELKQLSLSYSRQASDEFYHDLANTLSGISLTKPEVESQIRKIFINRGITFYLVSSERDAVKTITEVLVNTCVESVGKTRRCVDNS